MHPQEVVKDLLSLLEESGTVHATQGAALLETVLVLEAKCVHSLRPYALCLLQCDLL